MPNLSLPLNDTAYTRIQKYLNNPESPELSDKDKRLYERYMFAYDNLHIESKKNVVGRLIRKFEISQTQAYKDCEDAIRLLNPRHYHDKEFLRTFLIEDILKNIRRANAWENSGAKYKALERLYGQLIKAAGINNEDIEGFDPEMLGNNKLYAQFIINNQTVYIDFDNNKVIPIDIQKQLIEANFQDITEEEAQKLISKEDGN